MRILKPRHENEATNSVYFVPAQHIKPVMSFCGHKVDVYRQPNTNCDQCWYFWFIHNTEFTQTAMLDYQRGDAERKQLVTKFGKKFVQKLGRFIDRVREAKEIHDALDKNTTEALEQPETFDLVFRADGRQAVVPTGAPSPFEDEPFGDIPLEGVPA